MSAIKLSIKWRDERKKCHYILLFTTSYDIVSVCVEPFLCVSAPQQHCSLISLHQFWILLINLCTGPVSEQMGSVSMWEHLEDICFTNEIPAYETFMCMIIAVVGEGELDVLVCGVTRGNHHREASFTEFTIVSVSFKFILCIFLNQGLHFRNSGSSHLVWAKKKWSFMLCVLLKAHFENVYLLHATLCSLSAESQARPR